MRKIIFGIYLMAITTVLGAGVARAQNPVAELKKLDQQRMKAISDSDVAAAAALLADDYVHVHATGEVMNKPEYLEFLAKNPRKSHRAPDANLIIHVYGDIAVMVGPQINTRGESDPPTMFMLTLVWRKMGGTWKQVDAAYTALPAPKK